MMMHQMADLDAPIIPGQSAGGIVVGSRIEAVLRDAGELFTPEPVASPFIPESERCTRYRSPAIDLWVKDGIVTQVGVHDGYRGKLSGAVGIGSTVGDLEDCIGAWDEDREDELVILGVPGLIFDMASECPACLRAAGQPYRHVPITEFYAFAPEL
jgi:hypothetical protein